MKGVILHDGTFTFGTSHKYTLEIIFVGFYFGVQVFHLNSN